MPNVALSLGWIYHKVANNYNNTFQYLRPYETWVAATPATPFLDDKGNPVTVYTYPASEVGAAFNVLKAVNAPTDRSDVFHSFEIAATKRYSKKWTGAASFWTTKNHQWIVATGGLGNTPQSPNDDRFPIINTWDWEARANVTYNLPLDIAFSSSYRAQSGQAGQRTQVFTAPASVLRQGNVTLRMGPYGEYRGPTVQIIAIKAAKKVSLGLGRALEVNFQVFNLMNSSGITSINRLTGTQFGNATGITSGRVARIGTSFTF